MKYLSSTATGRDASFFAADLAAAKTQIKDAVKGARILAVGAAGSIGSNTVHTLAGFEPAALHVIDQNENALAELVRELRSAKTPLNIADFRTLPLDYGSESARLLMEAEGPYDRVLNFAAIKHVRSEKDPFSILQMFDTNIVKQARLRDWIAQSSPNADYFSVSTDKAANPVSFMGATKRIMEHVLFDGARSAGLTGRVTTARFANVAYSNGSLLQAFEKRLARGEPLACPLGIERYFVSLQESGHICTLASIIPEHAHIAIPRLDPEEHLVPLQSVAEKFLAFHGLQPEYFDDEDAACNGVEAARAKGHYPLLLTPANTAGEKPYEEFIGRDETASEIGLSKMQAIAYRPLEDTTQLPALVKRLEAIVLGNGGAAPSKDELKHMIGEIEPAFLRAHIDSKLNLDQRV